MNAFSYALLVSAILSSCCSPQDATPEPIREIPLQQAREAREKALQGDLKSLQIMVNWTFQLPLDEMNENETMYYWENRLKAEAKRQGVVTVYGEEIEIYKGKPPREVMKP